MDEKVIEETEKYIEQLLEEGLEQNNNMDDVYKLIDIQKDAYEIKCMKEEEKMYNEYGNYGMYGGRGPSRGSYGNYGRGSYGEYNEGGSYGNYGRGGYGARGRDSRYRGDDLLDRMYGEYGRYQESRSYGAGEETDKSFHYMVKALEDFIKVLYEEAETQQQKQMLAESLQRSMMM